MSGDPFEQARREADPVQRARMATRLLAVYQQRSAELARLRREAVDELQRQGLSYAEVAARIGLSKARVGQIKLQAPPAARALFGVGPVQVWTPARAVGRSLPVVATEDALTAQEITRLLDALGFTSTQHHIPPAGDWSPDGDAVVVCGPKSHPVAARWIAADPALDLVARDGRWRIVERATGTEHTSPMDDPEDDSGQPVPVDLAYVSRHRSTAPGRDGEGERAVVRWHIAGIHAIGSLGAAAWLTEHAARLWSDHGDRGYSLVVASTHDGAAITETHTVTEPIHHDH
ncbi:MAG: hypothetical protein ACFCVG_19405 [Kineosporiaceae bacterium]